jgi:hypothetical protein
MTNMAASTDMLELPQDTRKFLHSCDLCTNLLMSNALVELPSYNAM